LQSKDGYRLRIVEVPGMHMVQWDAFDEVAAAVEHLSSITGSASARPRSASVMCRRRRSSGSRVNSHG